MQPLSMFEMAFLSTSNAELSPFCHGENSLVRGLFSSLAPSQSSLLPLHYNSSCQCSTTAVQHRNRGFYFAEEIPSLSTAGCGNFDAFF